MLNASLAIVWGTLWYDVASAPLERATDYTGVLFFMVAHFFWHTMFSSLGAFPKTRDVLTKERASETYHMEAFFVSSILVEVPVKCVLPLLFYLIICPLAGFSLRVSVLLYFATLVNVQVASSLSMLISATVFDFERSGVIATVLMVYQMCSGGYFIRLDQLPAAMRWIRWTSTWYFSMGVVFNVAVRPLGEEMREATEQYTVSELPTAGSLAVLATFCVVAWGLTLLQLMTTRKLKFE